jgi:hypothetical protein
VKLLKRVANLKKPKKENSSLVIIICEWLKFDKKEVVKVQTEEKIENTIMVNIKTKVQSILKSIHETLLPFIAKGVGVITLTLCLFIVFRHGSGLADVSFVELGFFIWLLYCFNAAKDLAQEQQRSIYIFFWEGLKLTGWLMIWSFLAYVVWFKWGSEFGFKANFFASNLFEVTLLLVVGIGAGLGVLVNVELDENKQEEVEKLGESA